MKELADPRGEVHQLFVVTADSTSGRAVMRRHRRVFLERKGSGDVVIPAEQTNELPQRVVRARDQLLGDDAAKPSAAFAIKLVGVVCAANDDVAPAQGFLVHERAWFD